MNHCQWYTLTNLNFRQLIHQVWSFCYFFTACKSQCIWNRFPKVFGWPKPYFLASASFPLLTKQHCGQFSLGSFTKQNDLRWTRMSRCRHMVPPETSWSVEDGTELRHRLWNPCEEELAVAGLDQSTPEGTSWQCWQLCNYLPMQTQQKMHTSTSCKHTDRQK